MVEASTTSQGSSLSDSEILSICDANIISKISLGYHQELFLDPENYLETFASARTQALCLRNRFEEGELVLVEPRISFSTQLRLNGINLDPAVFYEPEDDPADLPYPVLVKAHGLHSTIPLSEKIKEGSTDGWKAATPLVGVSVPRSLIYDNFSLSMPGGEIKKVPGLTSFMSGTQRSLVLERHLGLIRATHHCRSEKDAFLTVLLMKGLD